MLDEVWSPGEMHTGVEMSSRREFGEMMALGVVAAMSRLDYVAAEEKAMKIVCFIRYQIDPYQREAFKQYAENWGRIIPRCGGELVGYFLPYEGTNDVGWGLIAFASLAAYEQYRLRLKVDAEAIANFNTAQRLRFILREERSFLEVAQGTYRLPA